MPPNNTPWDLPVAFYFKVEFQGDPKIEDIAFQEVSGLDLELELEPLQEGGVNNAVYQLPKGVKSGKLSLKRAVLPVGGGHGSTLTDWMREVFGGSGDNYVRPRNLLVHLLDANGDTLHLWACTNAYPVKWAAESFESQKNGIAMANMDFVYTTLTQRQ